MPMRVPRVSARQCPRYWHPAAPRLCPAHGPMTPPRSPRNASYTIDARLDPASRTITGSEIITWRNITTKPADDLQLPPVLERVEGRRARRFMRERALAGRRTRHAARRMVAPHRRHRHPSEASASDRSISPRTTRFIAPDDGNADDRDGDGRCRLPQPVAPGGTRDHRDRVDGARAAHVRAHRRHRQLLLHRAVVSEARRAAGRGLELPSVPRRHRVLLRLRRLRRLADGAAPAGSSAPPASSASAATTPTARRRTATTRRTSTTSRGRRAPTTSSGRRASSTRRCRRSRCACCCSPSTPARPSAISTRRATTLKYYGEWFGAYPYGHITIVDPAFQSGAGGMEYPTLFTAGTRWLAPRAASTHAGRRHGPRSRPPVLVRHRRQQRVRGRVDGRRVQHLLDGARDGAGLRRRTTSRCATSAASSRGCSRDIALEPRDRRQPACRATGATPKSDAQSTPSYRYFPSTGGTHHLQQDRAVAEHAGALARLADAAARSCRRTSRAGSSSTRSRTISSRSPTRSAGHDLELVLRPGVSQLERVRLRRPGPEERRATAIGYRTTVVVAALRRGDLPGRRARDLRRTASASTEHWDGARSLEAVHLRSAVARGVRRRSIRIACCCSTSTTRTTRRRSSRGARDGGDEVVADVDGLAAGLPAVVGGARMSAVGRLARRHPPRQPARRRILLGVWALTLLVSLPLALALRGDAGAASRREPGRRHGGERRELRLDAGVQRAGDRARRRRFKPTIIGFGAVLDNLSALLDDDAPGPSSSSARRPSTSCSGCSWPAASSIATRAIAPRARTDSSPRRGVFFFRFLRLAARAVGSSTACCSARCTRGCSTGCTRGSPTRSTSSARRS